VGNYVNAGISRHESQSDQGDIPAPERGKDQLFFSKQGGVANLIGRVVGLADGAVFLAGLAMHAVAHREARHVGIRPHYFSEVCLNVPVILDLQVFSGFLPLEISRKV
jgi:hypothetical protein